MTFRARILILLCLFLWAPPALTEKPVPHALPIDRSGGAVPLESGYLSDLSYEDESIRVVLEKTTVNETTCFVGHITIAHPSQLRSEAAGKSWQYGRASKGEKLAQRVNAVLAINGDYYNYIGNGYMIRQGECFRNDPDPRRDVLLIDDQGDFHIVCKSTPEKIAQYKDHRIINTYNFGPALVMDGKPLTEFEDYNNGAFILRQRVAVAQAGPLDYYVFVTEARSDGSRGMTLAEFAAFVGSYPVQTAYNLDGGNSAHLIFHGERLNAKGFRDVRDISDILYFASTAGLK